MGLRRLVSLLICGMGILYTEPLYTASAPTAHALQPTVLEEDTDLKNIEDISQGILENIIKKIPLTSLSQAVVFLPETTYSSSALPIETVFNSVFTQALIETMTQQGIAIAPYNKKKEIVQNYAITLEKKLAEKAQFEQKNLQEIENLQNSITERKHSIEKLENEAKEIQLQQAEHSKALFSSRSAYQELIKKYEHNLTKERERERDIAQLKRNIAQLQSEIQKLNAAEQKTMQELTHAQALQESVELILSVKETPIVEVSSIEETKRQAYRAQSRHAIMNKEDILSRIKKAREIREDDIIKINSQIIEKEQSLQHLKDSNPTMTTAIAQSKARVQLAEKEYLNKQSELNLQRAKIQKERENITLTEDKITYLKDLNPIEVPKMYEIHVSYTNVESVLFITVQVNSGLDNNTIYLSKHTANVTPYTAMLLNQAPLNIHPYTVRSVPRVQPQLRPKVTKLRYERGVH